MANEVGFSLSNVPAHARNTKSQAMQNMAGGMAGGGFGNRISLKNSKFRMIQNGEEVEALNVPHLDVVIFALSNSVQRMYWENPFEVGSKEPPTCYSFDGKVPSPESPKLQSKACATCPQNIKGSGRMAGTKACAYKKRVVVLPPQDLEGAPYSLDVSGQSMFGEQLESLNKFSFKGYYEKLAAHGVDIAAIVTRLAFDDKASVPKLHFSPVRTLTEEEYAIVQKRMDDEEVHKMLKDLTNEAEMEERPQQTKPTPQPKAPEPEKPAVDGLIPAKTGKTGFSAGNGKVETQPKKGIAIDLDALTDFDA